MTFLIPIAMFGLPILAIIIFRKYPPQEAILLTMIGGFLFLPMWTYELSGLPDYNKEMAISLSLIIGVYSSNLRKSYSFRLSRYDIPMLIWCTFSPFMTSITNGLGIYNAISTMMENYLTWGLYFWIGRIYFKDQEALRKLSKAIIFFAFIYAFPSLFEVRFSPVFSQKVYGFFAHDWLQHIRYGGFRPIVFMQHGLMLSLWMAVAFTLVFWHWRCGSIKKMKSIPVIVIVLFLLLTTIMCKSVNGWAFMIIGIVCYYSYTVTGSLIFMKVLLFAIPAYIFFRAKNIISIEQMQYYASQFIDAVRLESLTTRLTQEDYFNQRTLLRPLFGWGGYGRGWPRDPVTGALLVRMVDSFAVIISSKSGFVGLGSIFLALLIGPWKVISNHSKKEQTKKNNIDKEFLDDIALGLILIFFIIDSLQNGMKNPIYILCAGAVTSYAFEYKYNIIHTEHKL